MLVVIVYVLLFVVAVLSGIPSWPNGKAAVFDTASMLVRPQQGDRESLILSPGTKIDGISKEVLISRGIDFLLPLRCRKDGRTHVSSNGRAPARLAGYRGSNPCTWTATEAKVDRRMIVAHLLVDASSTGRPRCYASTKTTCQKHADQLARQLSLWSLHTSGTSFLSRQP